MFYPSSSEVEGLRTLAAQELAEYRSAKRTVQELKAELGKEREELQHLEEARQIVQTIGEQIQRRVHLRLSTIVSRCLQLVFEEPYEFQIIYERSRGKATARLVFYDPVHKAELDPLSASGGGVVDIAGFALRLACVVLAKPPLRRLLVLDEPFKFVSASYRPRVKQMLEELSRDLRVQIIMVSHIEEIQTGTIIDLTKQ